MTQLSDDTVRSIRHYIDAIEIFNAQLREGRNTLTHIRWNLDRIEEIVKEMEE